MVYFQNRKHCILLVTSTYWTSSIHWTLLICFLKLVSPCCLHLGPHFRSFPCKVFLNFVYVFNVTFQGSICSLPLHCKTSFHSFLSLFSFMRCLSCQSLCWSRKRLSFPKDICVEHLRHNFPGQIFWFLSALYIYVFFGDLYFLYCIQLWPSFVAIVSPLSCVSTSGTVAVASGLLKLLIFTR